MNDAVLRPPPPAPAFDQGAIENREESLLHPKNHLPPHALPTWATPLMSELGTCRTYWTTDDPIRRDGPKQSRNPLQLSRGHLSSIPKIAIPKRR